MKKKKKKKKPLDLDELGDALPVSLTISQVLLILSQKFSRILGQI